MDWDLHSELSFFRDAGWQNHHHLECLCSPWKVGGRANHTLALTGFWLEMTHGMSYISLPKVNHTCVFNFKEKYISPTCLEGGGQAMSVSSSENTSCMPRMREAVVGQWRAQGHCRHGPRFEGSLRGQLSDVWQDTVFTEWDELLWYSKEVMGTTCTGKYWYI